MATTIRTETQTPTDLREWIRKIDALGELPLRPTSLVDSGNGIHVLFGLLEPIGREMFDRVEAELPGYVLLHANDPGAKSLAPWSELIGRSAGGYRSGLVSVGKIAERVIGIAPKRT